jgi:replication factor C subunit 2/4
MSRTDTITESQKSDILHRMALVDKALIDGADEYLQFMDLAAHIMNVLATGKE